MSFWTTIASGANWLDNTLGTGGVLNRGVATVAGYATNFYQKNIAGSFLEDVGKNLASSAATAYVAGGQQQPGYSVPLPQGRQISGQSSVRPGNFTAKQAQQLGLNNPRVQEAYRKAAASQNRQIAAALEMVRPRTTARGPTKSLAEAQIGTKKS